MHKLALAAVAIFTIGAVHPAVADESGAAAAGGAAGAATGAAAGLFIAGPIGAAVGGIAGAGMGAGVSSSAQDYARAHRRASITYEGEVRPGYRVGHGLHLYAVPDDEQYSYVYVNDKPVLIDSKTDTVVWVGD